MAKAQEKTKTTKATAKKKRTDIFELKLYVAGQTPRSMAAFSNLKKVCEEHLQGKYKIEVVDLLKNPKLAKGDEILAIPTLVKKLPAPLKKIIGDLSDSEKLLVGLDLKSSYSGYNNQ